jgi:two-component system, sensor histidine kinase YesM
MARVVGSKPKSTFTYLTLTFLLALLPLCAVGGYVFTQGLTSVTDEIAQSTQAQAAFFLSNLESDVERIHNLQAECLNDTNLQRLLLRHEIMDAYDYIDSINQLIYRLLSIKSSSAYITNVSIHSKALNKTISSNSLLDPLNEDHFSNIRVDGSINGAQFVNYNGTLYLSTLRKNQIYRPMMENLVEIELDMSKLSRAIEQFNTMDGSGSFLVGLSGEFSLAASKEQNLLQPADFIGDLHLLGDTGQGYTNVNNAEYFYTYVKSTYLDAILLRYFPKNELFTPAHNLMTWIMLLLLLLLVVVVGFWFSTYRLIQKPLAELMRGFQIVQSGDFKVRIHTQYPNEFQYLCTRFNEMTSNLSSLINQVYKQKIMNQQAELKQLQSQINPHFLYNSFFLINTMARLQDDNLLPFTHHLGEYFQYITRNASPYVTLYEEVEHTRTYANIQRMRFTKRLDIAFEPCPPAYAQMKVPRLMLQPILENTFNYVVEKQQTQGIVRVSYVPAGEMLMIIVEDNGRMLTDEKLLQMQEMLLSDTFEDMETTGMINIHRRIRLIYGTENSIGLTLERSALGGLKVSLKIGGAEHVSLADC